MGKGNGSLAEAARPERAEPLFGAVMAVELVNDGPVTIVLEASDVAPIPSR